MKKGTAFYGVNYKNETNKSDVLFDTDSFTVQSGVSTLKMPSDTFIESNPDFDYENSNITGINYNFTYPESFAFSYKVTVGDVEIKSGYQVNTNLFNINYSDATGVPINNITITIDEPENLHHSKITSSANDEYRAGSYSVSARCGTTTVSVDPDASEDIPTEHEFYYVGDAKCKITVSDNDYNDGGASLTFNDDSDLVSWDEESGWNGTSKEFDLLEDNTLLVEI